MANTEHEFVGFLNNFTYINGRGWVTTRDLADIYQELKRQILANRCPGRGKHGKR